MGSFGEKIPLREVAVVAGCAVLVTILMTWPLATRTDEILPGMGKIGDPYLHTWQVAWQAHALDTDTGDFFDANTHWPHEDSLAFIDTLAGYTPAGLIGTGLEAAVVRYNLLYLFAYSMAFFGSYLLARQLGLGRAGAVVAAAAFAFAPWRFAQNGHLVVLSSGGIPLALFFFLRGYVRRSAGFLLAGGLVAAWQLSLGFTLGLQFVYLLGLLGVIFLIRVSTGRETNLPRGFIAGIAGAAAIVGLVGVLLAIPFLRVASTYPDEADRFSELRLYSPPPSGFLVAPEYNLLWGDAAESLRDDLRWPEEQTLFPGIAIVLLAGLGSLSPRLTRKTRVFLVAVTVGTAILSMGVAWTPSRYIYELFYDFAPGWQAVRTPGRLNTTTSLGLALLAGAGASVVYHRAAQVRRRPDLVAGALAVLMAVVVLIEGKGSIWAGTPRELPAALTQAEPPVMHLPFDEIHDRIYTFWSIEGFQPTVNGVGAIVPKELSQLRKDMEAFPDIATIEELRSLGVKTVVLHSGLAASTPWKDTAQVSVDGLGITRTDIEGTILFDLDADAD